MPTFHCRTAGAPPHFRLENGWRTHSWGAEEAAGSLVGCSLPTCPCLRHDPLLPNLRTPRSPPLRPPPRCGSRILLASTPSPARAADSAQLHTDLRPGPGPRLLVLADARPPPGQLRELVPHRRRERWAPGRHRRAGARSVAHKGAQPVTSAPRHPSSAPDPPPSPPSPRTQQGRPGCGCGGNGGVTERAGRGGFLTAGAVFTWHISSPRPAFL